MHVLLYSQIPLEVVHGVWKPLLEWLPNVKCIHVNGTRFITTTWLIILGQFADLCLLSCCTLSLCGIYSPAYISRMVHCTAIRFHCLLCSIQGSWVELHFSSNNSSRTSHHGSQELIPTSSQEADLEKMLLDAQHESGRSSSKGSSQCNRYVGKEEAQFVLSRCVTEIKGRGLAKCGNSDLKCVVVLFSHQSTQSTDSPSPVAKHWRKQLAGIIFRCNCLLGKKKKKKSILLKRCHKMIQESINCIITYICNNAPRLIQGQLIIFPTYPVTEDCVILAIPDEGVKKENLEFKDKFKNIGFHGRKVN